MKLKMFCFFIAFGMLLTSCEINTNSLEYSVIEIDSCEYILYGYNLGHVEISHKGNCKNKIHICD